MKHPVRDRLLMLLYALASLAAAAFLIAVVFGRITSDMISGFSAQIHALPEKTLKISMGAAAVVLVVFALSLISALFPPKKKRSSSFAIQENENGMVRISLKTIDALVQKCLAQHDELKVVTSSLFSDEKTVRIDVHIVLLTDISMPLAISALQKQITRYVEACTGVNVREVRIFVDGALAGGEKAAQSKYALPVSLLGGEAEETEPAAEPEMTPAADEAETPAEEETAAEEAASSDVSEETAAEPETQTPAAEQETVQEETAEAAAEAQEVTEESVPAEEVPAEQEASQEPATEKKKKLFGLF